MAKFRKRPVEINAEPVRETYRIETREGTMLARRGTWAITGIAGEKYPCDRVIFEETYEPVDDEARALWREVYGRDA